MGCMEIDDDDGGLVIFGCEWLKGVAKYNKNKDIESFFQQRWRLRWNKIK